MWTDAIENNIYTAINTKVIEKFESKYPDVNCGKALRSNVTPQFPYVLVKKLSGAEQGQTLDRTGINAILTTFQIEVFDNTNEIACREISGYIGDILTKNFRFSMVGEPVADYDNADEYRYVARYRRLVGASDIINW